MSKWPVHGRITGPIVMIGFGSIGRGTLPLIERHFEYDKSRFVVIDPSDKNKFLLDERGIKLIQTGLTKANYREILTPLLTAGGGQGFCVNVSVDTSSLDIMKLCREIGAFYIDTVVEPWKGFYFDKNIDARRAHQLRAARNGARRGEKEPRRRDRRLLLRRQSRHGELVREAGAFEYRRRSRHQRSRAENAGRMGALHAKDRRHRHSHRRARHASAATPKPIKTFVNTWSIEGFISEGSQPAELGWGTHEKWMPDDRPQPQKRLRRLDLHAAAGRQHARAFVVPDAGRAIRLFASPTTNRFRSPTTSRCAKATRSTFRPTCNYAYHPANDAVLSLHEMFGSGGYFQPAWHIMDEDEIVEGIDELGVLLYGHKNNAYWYGSQLSIEETKVVAPYQNATGLQVTSAVMAGMVWALENPKAGIVETDEMDFRRCLDVQMPYLGPVIGTYTDWNPLKDRNMFFPEDLDHDDPWQFKNILVRNL